LKSKIALLADLPAWNSAEPARIRKGMFENPTLP